MGFLCFAQQSSRTLWSPNLQSGSKVLSHTAPHFSSPPKVPWGSFVAVEKQATCVNVATYLPCFRHLIDTPFICASGTGCSGQALPRSRARLRAPPNEEGQGERRRCHAFGNFLAWDLLAETLPSGAGRGEGDGIWFLGAAVLRRDCLLIATLACVYRKDPLWRCGITPLIL